MLIKDVSARLEQSQGEGERIWLFSASPGAGFVYQDPGLTLSNLSFPCRRYKDTVFMSVFFFFLNPNGLFAPKTDSNPTWAPSHSDGEPRVWGSASSQTAWV